MGRGELFDNQASTQCIEPELVSRVPDTERHGVDAWISILV